MFSQNKLKIYSGYVNQKIKDSKKIKKVKKTDILISIIQL
jgi:hypothetical protein